MNCEQFESQLDKYHDGELNAASALQVQSHARDCAKCASALRSMKLLSRATQSIPMAEISTDAMRRLHVEIDHAMDRSLLRWAGSLMGIAASILIVASAGLWFIHPAQASAPQPWEGAMLESQNGEAPPATNGAGGGAIEPDLPDLIVADLARSNTQ